MLETEIRGELEVLHVHVRAVMQLRSKWKNHEVEKEHFLTRHFTLLPAQSLKATIVRSVMDLCRLLINMETFTFQENFRNVNASSVLTHPGFCGRARSCGARAGVQSSGKCVISKQQFECAGAGVNTWPTTVAASAQRSESFWCSESAGIGRPVAWRFQLVPATKPSSHKSSTQHEKLTSDWKRVLRVGAS
jgi:hypothetical protein